MGPRGPAAQAGPGPVVEPGTGVLARIPPARSRASVTAEDTGDVTLNVVDADLREVVRLVLEDTLGVNYVIDPLVTGTITVQTTQPLPAENLIALLDAVLRLNGAALVRSGDLYKVVPIDQALTSGVLPQVRPVPDADRPGFNVQVVPLRYVGAAEMAEILAPFAPPGGAIQPDPSRNLLILAGSSDQLATLIDLVSIFDVDWLQGMSFGLFPLETVEAEQIVGELEQLFGSEEGGPLQGVVRFVPVERLNAILVISSQPDYLARAQTWIKRLDEGGEGDEPQVFVYPVQNGRAADLAEVLGQLFDVSAATVGEADLVAPGIEAAELRSPRRSTFDEQEGAVEQERDAGDLRRGRRALGTGPAERLRLGQAEAGALGASATRIIADQTTNSLVIRATPLEYRRIAAALQQLDVLPLQVLIEATIAEVTLRDALRYGVEWFFRFGSNEVRLSNPDTGRVAPVPGFSALFTSADDVRIVLNALESVTDVNVISSPQILVLDNQTAQLEVGDEVPIVTQQAESAFDGDVGDVVNTVEQRQTGVILSVTPRVNASGLVIMEIEQEVSDVAETTTSGIDSPTISQRRIASTVGVQSGETVALGGLIQDDVERGNRGVPLLSRLPAVGWLFGTTSNRNERTELLVLITPRVVRNPAQARAVTAELRERLRGVVPLGGRID